MTQIFSSISIILTVNLTSEVTAQVLELFISRYPSIWVFFTDPISLLVLPYFIHCLPLLGCFPIRHSLISSLRASMVFMTAISRCVYCVSAMLKSSVSAVVGLCGSSEAILSLLLLITLLSLTLGIWLCEACNSSADTLSYLCWIGVLFLWFLPPSQVLKSVIAVCCLMGNSSGILRCGNWSFWVECLFHVFGANTKGPGCAEDV